MADFEDGAGDCCVSLLKKVRADAVPASCRDSRAEVYS